MEDIKPHPYLSRDSLIHISKVHNAVDSVLSLHYSSRQSLITAHELFSQVANLLQRRTKIEHFMCVLMVDEYAYKLIEPTGVKDYSPCYVALFKPVLEFNSELESRKSQFVKDLNKWIESHQHIGYFNIRPAAEIIELHRATVPRQAVGSQATPSQAVASQIGPSQSLDNQTEPTQSSSPSKSPSPRRSPSKISKSLKNDASKFAFKVKDENVETAKSGLSLLERIKLKEKLNNEKNLLQTPEMRRDQFLASKLKPIYNILYQMNSETKPSQFKSFPLSIVKATIKDSLDYPIHEDEIHDCLKLMSRKLPKVEIVTRSNLSVVKLYHFDRTEDLKVL